MFNVVVLAGIVITILTGIPVFLQLRQHPRGLSVLFFAEMWERFSYYGMRGLLIFYLTEHFLFDDAFAAGQYSAYTTLVYLAPLIGGFVADRWLGSRKAIAFGALLLVAGHFTMAIEGPAATQVLVVKSVTFDPHEESHPIRVAGRMEARTVCVEFEGACYRVTGAVDGGLRILGLPESISNRPRRLGAEDPLPQVLAKGQYRIALAHRDPLFVDVLYLALALIIMGVGFLKANISSIVGQLYPERDPRRDPGFTLYYYGINLGAFWASIVCGLVGQTVSWGAGFGLAGFGMLTGFLVFVLNKPRLEGKGEPPDPAALKARVAGPLNLEWGIYLAAIAGVALVWWLVRQYALMGWLLLAGWIVALSYVGFEMSRLGKVVRDRLLLALLLVFGSVIFFALAEQAGTSLNQFAERNTQLPDAGFWSMTAAQTQTFNPGYILLFSAPLAWLWTKLGQRGRDPNPLVKFGLGLVQIGLGFWVLTWAAGTHDAGFRTPLVFLGFSYLLQTTGELFLSPVGLSEMTKLAPARMISTLMAVWFLGASGAQYLAGLIARTTAAETIGGQVLDPAKALATYAHTFLVIGAWGVGAGMVFLALSPWLKRLAHGADDTQAVDADLLPVGSAAVQVDPRS